MDKAEVMRLVKRGPHATSCWAWRGPLLPRLGPTTNREAFQDPGKVLGATSGSRNCGNLLCVNPEHRLGFPKPEPHNKPPKRRAPKPKGKPMTLALKTRQLQEKKAVGAPVEPVSGTTECRNGHPQTPENVWTSPSTGKSKCKVCERERKKAARDRKAAAKR